MNSSFSTANGVQPVDLTLEPTFGLGRTEVRPATLELVRDGCAATVEPKVMQALVGLARRLGEVTARDVLALACWPGRYVSEDSIHRTIFKLRKAGEVLAGGDFVVENVRGVGYRLTAAVADAALVGARPIPIKPSIAVLPFSARAESADQQYFAEGMVEEIAAALSRFKSLIVVAGGSGLALKDRGLDSIAAGRLLGVRYLLEGSLRRSGEQLRISVRLIDAATGEQVWSERFDDQATEIFALQDRVALCVAGVIEPTIQAEEIRQAVARRPADMAAHDYYLQAWPMHRIYTKVATLRSLELATQAVALDPDYASALALAAVGHTLVDLYGWTDDLQSNLAQGVRMARRAAIASYDDAQALALAAFAVAQLERDEEAARALLDRAVALNPGCASVWYMNGLVRVRIGENELAIEHLQTAMRLDPIGPDRSNQIGFMSWARFQQRRFAEAIALGKEFVRLKDHPRGYAFLAASYGHTGDKAAKRAALERYNELADRSIESFAETFILDPDNRALFLEGVR